MTAKFCRTSRRKRRARRAARRSHGRDTEPRCSPLGIAARDVRPRCSSLETPSRNAQPRCSPPETLARPPRPRCSLLETPAEARDYDARLLKPLHEARNHDARSPQAFLRPCIVDFISRRPFSRTRPRLATRLAAPRLARAASRSVVAPHSLGGSSGLGYDRGPDWWLDLRWPRFPFRSYPHDTHSRRQ